MIEIKNRWTGTVIYSSTTANTLGEAVLEAIRAKANLSKADLSKANLSGADLSWANLSGADLSRADLSRANLSGADLSWANLSKADLSKANLSGANLSRADLSRANLSEANLSEANLSEADLSEANLSEANLRKANLRKANLSEANLSEAENIQPIDAMPSIKAEILKRVEALPACLQMEQWHDRECKTTHCLGGWATTLHPQGKLLESLLGPNAAAALIFHVSVGEVPNFYGSNEQAIEWLREAV